MPKQTAINIRRATRDDAPAVTRIYNHYITETTVTFEEEPVSADTIRDRMAGVDAKGLPWLVAERDGEVIGYAYASQLGPRSAYRYAAETAIYIDHAHAGTGVGSALYRELLNALAVAGKHMAVAVLSLPNDPSVALQERFGFEKVGHLTEVGYKLGRWLDVGYWQLELPGPGARPDETGTMNRAGQADDGTELT